MRLPDKVIARVKELADGMSYGRITIYINGDSPEVHVACERQERYAAHEPAPGVPVVEESVPHAG